MLWLLQNSLEVHPLCYHSHNPWTIFEILIPDPDEFFPRLDIENGLSSLTSLSAAEKNCCAQRFPTYYLWLVFFRSFYSTTSFTSPYPLCPCTILPSSGKRRVRALPLFNELLFIPPCAHIEKEETTTTVIAITFRRQQVVAAAVTAIVCGWDSTQLERLSLFARRTLLDYGLEARGWLRIGTPRSARCGSSDERQVCSVQHHSHVIYNPYIVLYSNGVAVLAYRWDILIVFVVVVAQQRSR